MLASMALAIAAFGYGQSGTTDPKTTGQDPAPQTPQQSVYHECLVNAGPYTWKVLGLNEDQVARISAVQTRYKESLQPPKEEKKDKKSKKDQAAKKVQNPAVNSGADQPKGEEGKSDNPDVNVRNSKNESEMNTLEGNTATAEGTEGQPVPATVSDELRTILTPEQWAQWDRQCAHPQMGSLTP
jgi:hypothetical protein